MIDTKTMLQYIKENTHCTCKQISDHFKLKQGSVSARLKMYFDQGRVKRKVVGATVTGINIYGYELVSFTTKHQKKTKANVSVKPKEVKQRMEESDVSVPQTDMNVQKFSVAEAMEHLSRALAEAIVGRVKVNLAVELNSLVPEPLPAVALPSPQELIARISAATAVVEHKRKKRVLVTGFLPQQEGILSQEFSDCFDIEFWNDTNGDGTGKLERLCKAADIVMVHINHVSHKTTEAIKRFAKEYKLVGGGLTAMRDQLTKLFVESSDVQ